MVYSLIYEFDGVVRDADGAIIPDDPKNIDWQGYQSWLAANNVPTAATVPPTPVPGSVALWQAKAVLQASGLLDAADAAIASANNPVLNQYWNSGANIDRTSPTLASLGASLNLTSVQIDQMFIEAATISL